MAEEAEATVSGSARPPLPGFSAKTERWVMELIYGKRCEAEEQYLKERRENVPITKVHLLKAKGFRATRYPSYIDVRPATPSVASNMSRRSKASLAGQSICSQQSRAHATFHPSTDPARIVEPIQELEADKRQEVEQGAGEGPSLPSLQPKRQANSFVMPKYALAKYTMNHMYLAECGSRSKSLQNLRTVIKPAQNARSTAASFFQQHGSGQM
mmetsp:Transcript_16998/g.40193  ORF Transcript_16998/g.40193 Transcript_16998/m.40193 type:complete len:213 (-) Transcript_16998:151-789(-)